ncbi:hypothetical protein V1506DRAFT_547177 [Lipomyces tetrasporus]
MKPRLRYKGSEWMGQPKAVRVQILFVPDCPLVGSVRNMLQVCLKRTQANAVMEDMVGEMSCRVDVQSKEMIAAALERRLEAGFDPQGKDG